MISRSAEYSLRAVMCLAAQPGRQALTTRQIARQTHLPASYLAKVLHTLGRAGIVTSQRGLNGGYLLKLTPASISLLAVVAALEPIGRWARSSAAPCRDFSINTGYGTAYSACWDRCPC